MARGHDVIHVHVVRELPFAGQRIIGNSRLVLDMQSARTQILGKFLRRDELAPFMGSARNPSKHIFSSDNRQSEALQGPVEGSSDQQSARPHHQARLVKEVSRIGDMLNDFHRQYGVEDGALSDQLLRARATVIDGKISLGGMVPVSYTHLRAHETDSYL